VRERTEKYFTKKFQILIFSNIYRKKMATSSIFLLMANGSIESAEVNKKNSKIL